MKQHDWWDHADVQAVRQKAAKYGCKKDNLPVAVYWYQKYEEDKPGFMPTGLFKSGWSQVCLVLSAQRLVNRSSKWKCDRVFGSMPSRGK